MNKRQASDILAELNTANLKNSLSLYPARIKDQKAVIRSRRAEYEEANQTRSLLEAEIMTEVSAEVNGAGKPAFSNDTSRRAECMKRQGASYEYQEAAKAAKAAEWSASEAQDELDKLQDEYKSLRIVARLVADEVALYASTDPEDELRGEVDELPWPPKQDIF